MESPYHCKISDCYKLSENFLVYVQQSAWLKVIENFSCPCSFWWLTEVFLFLSMSTDFSSNIRRDTSMEICIDIMRWIVLSRFCQVSKCRRNFPSTFSFCHWNVDVKFRRQFATACICEMSMEISVDIFLPVTKCRWKIPRHFAIGRKTLVIIIIGFLQAAVKCRLKFPSTFYF